MSTATNLARIKALKAEAATNRLAFEALKITFASAVNEVATMNATISTLKGTSPNSIDSILGTFNTTPRNAAAIKLAALTVLSANNCMALSANEKSKVKKSFIAGFPRPLTHFKAISSKSNLLSMMSINNLVALSKQADACRSHLTSITTNSVFYVLTFDSNNVLIPPSNLVDLPFFLICAKLPPLADVVCTCKHHAKYSTSFQLENLKWSYDALLNSCDACMRKIVLSKMLKYPTMPFGPIVYWFIIHQLTNADSSVIRTITSKLTSINISKTTGQSNPSLRPSLKSEHAPPGLNATACFLLTSTPLSTTS